MINSDRVMEQLQARRHELLDREKTSHERLRNLQAARMREIERIEYRFNYDMRRIEKDVEKIQHDLRNLERDIERHEHSVAEKEAHHINDRRF